MKKKKLLNLNSIAQSHANNYLVKSTNNTIYSTEKVYFYNIYNNRSFFYFNLLIKIIFFIKKIKKNKYTIHIKKKKKYKNYSLTLLLSSSNNIFK